MKAAILLVSSHSTIVLLGAEVFLSVSFVLNVAYVTIHLLLWKTSVYAVFNINGIPQEEMHSSDSSERSGNDFSAVKHQSRQPARVFSVQQKQEMDSSEF